MNKKINKIIEELTSNEPVIAEEFSNEAYCYYCGSPSDSNMSREVDHAEDCIITLAHEVKLASLKARLKEAKETKISSYIDEASIELDNYLESRNL